MKQICTNILVLTLCFFGLVPRIVVQRHPDHISVTATQFWAHHEVLLPFIGYHHMHIAISECSTANNIPASRLVYARKFAWLIVDWRLSEDWICVSDAMTVELINWLITIPQEAALSGPDRTIPTLASRTLPMVGTVIFMH